MDNKAYLKSLKAEYDDTSEWLERFTAFGKSI